MKHTKYGFITAILLLVISCQKSPPPETDFVFFEASHPFIRYMGRFEFTQEGQARFAWPGSQVRVRFEGTRIRINLKNHSEGNDRYNKPNRSFYQIWIDDQPQILEATNEGETYLLADSLPDGPHELIVFKRTEAETGIGVFEGLELASGKKLLPLSSLPPRQIEFIGNSISCGYGNEGKSRNCHFSPDTENAWMSFASITARNLHAAHTMICYSGRGIVQNYDKSRTGTLPQLWDRIYPQQAETSWDFSSYSPQLVVINLGTNDFAHENPEEKDFVNTYASFIQRIRRHYPGSTILCLSGPMISDNQARRPLSTLKNYLDKAISQSGLKQVYRFDLSTQGPLGYGCDWHPNIAQHQKNADELTAYIAALMKW